MISDLVKEISGELQKNIEFWRTKSFDPQYGGFFTCITDTGLIYDEKKYGWLMGRQAWVYSRLLLDESNHINNRSELRSQLDGTIEFMKEKCLFKDKELHRVYFAVHRDGRPAAIQRKIFSECFFTMGFLAYYALTKKEPYKTLAQNLFQSIQMMDDDGSILRPSDAKFRVHSNLMPLNVPMIMLNIISEFWDLLPETRTKYHSFARWCLMQIRAHRDLKNSCMREMCTGENLFDDKSSEGRLVCPGHVIECGWFILSLSRFKFFDMGFDYLKFSENVIEEAFSKGWDPKCGGVIYFCDALNLPREELEHNLKLWWPMTEALIAYAYLWQLTRKKKYLSRVAEIWSICKKHFIHGSGEWYGYLDSSLNVNQRILGGPYKGCFHVPRALWLTANILQETTKDSKL